jgi:N-terminal half of MaoC dehydratase
MPLNPAIAGKTYPPVEFLLDAERVRAFATAIGHPSDDVPPTIVTVPEIAAGLANVLADPELGLDLSRVLHGEQEYEWGHPFVVGERVMAEATIEDIRTKAGLEILRLRTDLRDEAGRTVVVGRSTLIVRSGA